MSLRSALASLVALCFLVQGASRIGRGQELRDGQISRLALQFNSGHAQQVVKISSDSARGRFASVGYEGSVKLWDSKSGRLIASTSELYTFPLALTLTSDGEHVAISSRDGDITLLSIRGLRRESIIHVPRFQRTIDGMSLPN